MSQAGIISTSSGPVPPQVPTSFVADSGTATPAANILNVPGAQATTNIDNGVRTTGSGNTLSVVLTNRTTGTVSTADATLTTLVTFPLGATPGVYFVYGNVQAFNSTTPAGGCYGFSAGFRTDGATATEIATQYHDEFEEAALASADIFVSASGNNVLLQVQGVAATSINWNALLEFRMVS